MSVAKLKASSAPLAPPAAELRRMFAASAEALLANRPLQAVSSPATQPASALSRWELSALTAVGLLAEPWQGEPSEDPLSRTVVDYVALIETSLSTAEAARMLAVDVSRIRQRVRDRSLFGVEHEGEWRLPRFQFERRKVLPGLSVVLARLPGELNTLEVAEWFLSANPDLEVEGRAEPLSPREWLLQGLPPERVADLARHL